MLLDGDDYQVAKMMIDRHGEMALVAAARRADDAKAAKDPASYAEWRRIIDAIDQVQRHERRPDAAAS